MQGTLANSHLQRTFDKPSRFSNQRLYTRQLAEASYTTDASEALKQQIGESMLRLRAAQHGHSINEIVPSHHAQFYAPCKRKYLPSRNALL